MSFASVYDPIYRNCASNMAGEVSGYVLQHATINDLPFEMIEYILSKVPCRDIVLSAQYVNDWWSDACNSPHVWRNIVYQPTPEESVNEIIRVLKLSPQLRSLILIDVGDISAIIDAICENCPKLRYLEYSGKTPPPSGFLIKFYKNCPNLLDLTLSVRTEHNENWKGLDSFLAKECEAQKKAVLEEKQQALKKE